MKQAYILLSLAKIPPKKQVEVINFYGSSEEFWNNWQNNDEILEVLSVEEISSLKDVIIENGVERHLKGLKATNSDVICIDDEASDKTISDAEELISSGEISYLYTFDGDSLNDTAEQLLTAYPDLKEQKLHKLNILTDSDRTNKKDYINIMNNNLDLIKQELYQ